jgi:hypothetical protein
MYVRKILMAGVGKNMSKVWSLSFWFMLRPPMRLIGLDLGPEA